VVLVTNQISGIAPGVIYYCRLVVSNAYGVTYGPDRPFGIGSTLWNWGDGVAPSTVPVGTGSVVAVTAGEAHNLTLSSRGRVIGWLNSNGPQNSDQWLS
jgi:hypothetical protein